jgi:hypothetical protein
LKGIHGVLTQKIQLFKMFSPCILYVYEIWPFTLDEKRRLEVSENRERRRMFGPKRKKVKAALTKQNR